MKRIWFNLKKSNPLGWLTCERNLVHFLWPLRPTNGWFVNGLSHIHQTVWRHITQCLSRYIDDAFTSTGKTSVLPLCTNKQKIVVLTEKKEDNEKQLPFLDCFFCKTHEGRGFISKIYRTNCSQFISPVCFVLPTNEEAQFGYMPCNRSKNSALQKRPKK